MLDEGVRASIEELATRERVNSGYMTRVLRLMLLAPDIVEAILSGRRPERMRLEELPSGGCRLAARKSEEFPAHRRKCECAPRLPGPCHMSEYQTDWRQIIRELTDHYAFPIIGAVSRTLIENSIPVAVSDQASNHFKARRPEHDVELDPRSLGQVTDIVSAIRQIDLDQRFLLEILSVTRSLPARRCPSGRSAIGRIALHHFGLQAVRHLHVIEQCEITHAGEQ